MKKILVIICYAMSLVFCADAIAQQKKLVIWSHWGQEPVKVNFMNAVAEQFTQEYGVAVEIVWLSKNTLAEKLVFALDTPEPDITYIDALAKFAHPRIWRSLSDLSELRFSGQIAPGWGLGDVGENKNSFLPIEGISNAMYYNKQLFQQADIRLPQNRALTGREFLGIIRKLRAAGITPIGEGAADREQKAGIPIINAIFRYAGPEKVAQLYRGEIDFSDPDVVAALKFWKQVVDAQGYDSRKALQLTLSEGIFEVTDGKAAISFCGTYIYSKYGATERDKGQIGILDWFTVENGKGNDYYEIFWAAGFGMNRHSAHPHEAKKFLEYLMTPSAASLWGRYVQAPYPIIAEKLSPDSLYETLMVLRKDRQAAPEPFTYGMFSSKAAQQMWQEETKQFIAGKRSVEQFIERMNSRLE